MKAEKRCSKCGQTKPVAAFDRYASGRDGLRAYCKVCRREYQRVYMARRYASDPAFRARKAAISARWYARHSERARRIQARWRAENRDYERLRLRTYRRTNTAYRERERLRVAAWRARKRAEQAAQL